MYYIYKFFNKKDELLYIGKTTDIKNRMKQHFSEDNWKQTDVNKVEIAECNCKTDMDIYEIYYINKLKPLHNISSVNFDTPTILLKELEFVLLNDDIIKPSIKPDKKSQKELLFERRCNDKNVLKIYDRIDVKLLIEMTDKYSYFNIEDKILFKIECNKKKINYKYLNAGGRKQIELNMSKIKENPYDILKNNQIYIDYFGSNGNGWFSAGLNSMKVNNDIVIFSFHNPSNIASIILKYIDLDIFSIT